MSTPEVVPTPVFEDLVFGDLVFENPEALAIWLAFADLNVPMGDLSW
jgi:hypothetical protein